MAYLDEVFRSFTKLAGAKNFEEEKQMNSKACAKMVKDYLPKEVVTIADASIFPKYKERNKPYLLINNFQYFIRDCAHEYAKNKNKTPKLSEDDPQVDKYYQEFIERLMNVKPNVKDIKISKNGNVAGLTDVSGYTGTHKERFDEEGKGKGMVGRKDMADNCGYVKGYKDEGTYKKKH